MSLLIEVDAVTEKQSPADAGRDAEDSSGRNHRHISHQVLALRKQAPSITPLPNEKGSLDKRPAETKITH